MTWMAHVASFALCLLGFTATLSAQTEKRAKPVAWDTEARAKLRREAEAANHAIELTPCQRVKDYVLSHILSAQK